MKTLVLALVGALAGASACAADHVHPDDGADAANQAADAADALGDAASGDCTPSGVTEFEAARISAAASVTVTATLLNSLQHCVKADLSIRVVMDTHAVDLLAIDLPAAARLELDDLPVAGDLTWTPASEGSHHRDGTLSVPAPPLLGASWLRLTLVDVAGLDRVFEWSYDLLLHDLP